MKSKIPQVRTTTVVTSGEHATLDDAEEFCKLAREKGAKGHEGVRWYTNESMYLTVEHPNV